MGNLLLIINSLILLLISAIHFYWAFGGKWGGKSVFPEIKNKPNLMPSPAMTIFAAMVFGLIACLIINRTPFLNIAFLKPYQIEIINAIAIIFGIRFIGEFKYLGVFKTEKSSLFAINDTKYYSPLCLFIAVSLLLSNYWL